MFTHTAIHTDYSPRQSVKTSFMKKQSGLLAIFAGFFVLCWASSTFAQDFNLFEEVDASGRQSPEDRVERENSEMRATISTPYFTLVGTSRIGDTFSVILADRNGEKIVIEAEPDANTAIPEYPDYQLVATANGKVSVRLPETAPCVEFPKSGVRCSDASNIAELTLPNNPAIKAPQVAAQAELVQIQDQNGEPVVEEIVNPFAIMRARANGEIENNPAAVEASPDGNSSFTPRRIDPSQVPEGSRIVSTPFGDRLVPL